MCPLLRTKPLPSSQQDDDFVAHIERLVRERNSKLRHLTGLSVLEWECILRWDAAVELYERAHQARLDQMFQIVMARMVRT